MRNMRRQDEDSRQSWFLALFTSGRKLWRLVISFKYVEVEGRTLVEKTLKLSQSSLFHFTTLLFPLHLHLPCSDNLTKVLKYQASKEKKKCTQSHLRYLQTLNSYSELLKSELKE